ncbi:hypothetical protein ACFSJW_06265 [Flavobacterium artemisiae]|uniref:Tetratricopeptide repeat protein n=2 Tax=Flavobacterium artemisiae TaxID=2126556 RepID=A0ABW4HCF9_9FLAO
MKDGSDVYKAFLTDSTGTKYIITPNKFTWVNALDVIDDKKVADAFGFNYNLVNNEIQTSQYSAYIIEKTTKDSLTLSQKLSDTPDEKLTRLYLLREEIVIANFKEKFKDKSNIVASTKFTPKTKKTFLKLLGEDFKKNGTYNNLRFNGKLFIYPKEKKVETTILYATNNDSQIKKIKKFLDESFEDWDLTGFENFDSIELPFIYEVKKKELIRGNDIRFFVNDVSIFDHLGGTTIDNKQKSLNYFKKAVESFQQKKFLKAAELFGKSFEINPENLDALYNKAACFSEIGDKENACKTWKQISDFGQVSGKELYLNNCK